MTITSPAQQAVEAQERREREAATAQPVVSTKTDASTDTSTDRALKRIETEIETLVKGNKK